MKLNYYLCSMKKSGIYKLTSPSGKCYIGQSTDMVQRILKYKRLQCKSQIKLYNAIQKYGFENFKRETLFTYEYTEEGKKSAFKKEAELVNKNF